MFRPGYKSGYQGRFEKYQLDDDFDDEDDNQNEDESESNPIQPEVTRAARGYDQDGVGEEEEEEELISKKQVKAAQINKYEKIAVISFSILVDGIQILLDILFGSGIIANRFIDIIFGILLFLYSLLRGLANARTTTATIAAFTGEQIPALDVAPFWTFDAFYLFYSNDQKIPIKIPGADKIIQKIVPMNVDGVRLPIKK